jgi:calcineurin-like phosphoesterase
VVNGENAADGIGLTAKLAEKLLAAGADVITTGNHVWRTAISSRFWRRASASCDLRT